MSLFPTTVWSAIRDAGAGSDRAAATFVERYRPAVVRFARRRGLDAAAAEDVAQEVFLRIFDARLLERADRARGRFRSLVLAVTRHVLGHHFERERALKRGGGKKTLALEPELEAALASDARDDEFDREWLTSMLGRALARLARENPLYEACFRASAIEGKSRRDIAAEHGKSEAVVRNAVSRGKAKLVAILRDEIATYSSSDREFEEELRYLASLLDPK